MGEKAGGEHVTIIEALTDRKLFGAVFPSLSTWSTWIVFLKTLFAIPIPEADLEEHLAVYRRHTGREVLPTTPPREAWLPIGRRGGKSRIAALAAMFLAAFRDYNAVLSPGERGVVMVIAQDRRQARVIFNYVTALIDNVPMLSSMVSSSGKEAIHLNNRISIEIHTCSFRAVRGYTIVAAICDEIAFWRSEDSANPDEEILAGIRPGMSTVPEPLLLCISSPYARKGALWNAYRDHYGKDGDRVLVWQADTLSMNPTIDQSIIEQAYEADEASASAEYGAEFRRDIESFVTLETIEACVVKGRVHLPPVPNISYRAFVDPSGGSRDSFSMAIGHHSDETIVLDVLVERRPPFSPESVVQEFAEVLRQYHVSDVVGDKYAGEWPREQFQKHGISYDASAAPKSDLYRDLLPILNSGKIELLDQKRLINQMVSLERRAARSGKDSIDHAPGGYDDVANAVAGLAVAGELKRKPIHTKEFSLWG